MTSTNHNLPPPEPPDISMHIDNLIPHTTTPSNTTPTYMQILLDHNQLNHIQNTCRATHSYLVLSDKTTNKANTETFIPLSTSNKARLYTPQKYSVIVKVFGRMGHQMLRAKLKILWKPFEDLPLIDLGSDFSLIKFQREKND